MKITFYGTRGSIPVSDRDYVEFGGNTSCVLVKFSTGRIAVLDAGTGIRQLGKDLAVLRHEQWDNIFIVFSHTHWDHIQGFPFFDQAYDPRRKLTLAIHGRSEGARSLRDIFTFQMQNDFFPVPLDKMGADLTFWEPEVTDYISPFGVRVTAARHNHPGVAYGYRLEEEGKVLVYCTDVEYGKTIDPAVVELSRDADLLIHDAQYTPEELLQKKGWGHSSWVQAVEVAEQAGVKRLALFHHDPGHPDPFVMEIEKQARRRFPNAFAAREGMEIEL